MRKKVAIPKAGCKLCGSKNLVKFGRYRGIQRWWCKDCRHKFAGNDAIPEMKTPAEQVAAAVDLYFSGVPLQDIPRRLFRIYGSFISCTSVFQWIVHFSVIAIDHCEQTGLRTGQTWMILETPARNEIKDVVISFLDVIDTSSGFLLATRMVCNRSQYDIKALIEQSCSRCGTLPQAVLTDGWKGHVHGISLALGGRACEIRMGQIDTSACPAVIKCWQLAVSNRRRIIAGLKKESTAQQMLQGWHVHYNYFSPNEALEGKTPGAVAEADYPFKSWSEVVRQAGGSGPTKTDREVNNRLIFRH
jgi:transposase-like protein